MSGVLRFVSLLLLLLLVTLWIATLLSAGGAAAQDDQFTPTPMPTIVGPPGQKPNLGEGAPDTGGESDSTSDGGSISCSTALVPLLGLAVFGAARGRRRRQA